MSPVRYEPSFFFPRRRHSSSSYDVPSPLFFSMLMIVAIRYSENSDLARATRRNMPDDILPTHGCETLRSSTGSWPSTVWFVWLYCLRWALSAAYKKPRYSYDVCTLPWQCWTLQFRPVLEQIPGRNVTRFSCISKQSRFLLQVTYRRVNSWNIVRVLWAGIAYVLVQDWLSEWQGDCKGQSCGHVSRWLCGYQNGWVFVIGYVGSRVKHNWMDKCVTSKNELV
jgi:hypothetical protein